MLYESLINLFCILLLINLLGIGFISSLRIYFIQQSSGSNYTRLDSDEPTVSIHYAICNEPINLVLETLKSFEELNYTNFEVIIISNNTINEKSWKPIEAYVKTISNFKFYHFDKVDGYKAGALNIALEKMRTDSKYIFTVDSDYKLHPDALIISVGTIESKDLDVLQFPQNYRNICRNTEGLQVNYKHYFECYLSAMDSEKFGLPTGTLTLIKTKIFLEGFIWPIETITEDAHLGVELLISNYKIGYCDVSIGRGTMPTNVTDYSKQFKRWVFGNFQTLVISFGNEQMSIRNKLRLFTMLTAWTNLLAIPILITFCAIPLIFTHPSEIYEIFSLILLSLCLHLITQLHILYITSNRECRKAIKALLIHTSTLEIGAFYWLSYVINSSKPFVRTNKYITNTKNSLLFYLLPTSLFIISNILLILELNLIGSILFAISTIGLLGKIQLNTELSYSKYNLLKLV